MDLSWNKLGDQAGNTIVEVLKINKNIQKIILDGNDISDSIKTAINAQLSHNVELHLKHTEMISKTSALNKELSLNKVKAGFNNSLYFVVLVSKFTIYIVIQ